MVTKIWDDWGFAASSDSQTVTRITTMEKLGMSSSTAKHLKDLTNKSIEAGDFSTFFIKDKENLKDIVIKKVYVRLLQQVKEDVKE